MRSIKVYKIGGSVLTEPADFRKIAHWLLQDKKTKICVITSAMKGMTTTLVNTFMNVEAKPDFWEFERFVGLGEIQAALLFNAAFKAMGKTAVCVLPWMKEWPLYVSMKSTHRMSREKINEKRDFRLLKRSYVRTRKYLMPILRQNKILVLPGFVARDSEGHTVTLGRGGSDISALLFSELLGARELVLLKEAEGVLDLDPNLYPQATKITSLSAGELGIMASSGAQILHPISLKHRSTLKRIHVTSINTNTKKRPGTRIEFKKSVTVHASSIIYSVLTFTGEGIPETPGLLNEISRVLAQKGISIFSITVSDNLIALYIEQSWGERAYELLSPVVKKEKKLRSLTLKHDIGKIVVRSLKFINEPGVIKKIVTPVAREGINIWEVLTAHTDVMIFLEYHDVRRTYEIINRLFNKNNIKA